MAQRRSNSAGGFRLVRLVAVVCVIIIVSASISYLLGPASSSHTRTMLVIRAGTRGPAVAAMLKRRGLIRSSTVFMWYAAFRGDSHKLKAGEYRLSPDMSCAEIIDRLKRGGSDSDERSVTIPEGYTVKQIAEALKSKGIVANPQSFLDVVSGPNPLLTAPFALPNNGLEGYLFPDTYRFLPNTRPERVAQVMLDEFVSRFYNSRQDDIARSGHKLHEIITIASLIEREAETNEDRPKIAGVIANRMKRGMRLDIDATVLYALGRHKSRVLYKDLAVNSPYNTYRHKGLPPGPIANPGLPSLEAALHPDNNAYLYYVAVSGRSHVFSRTFAEHNAAVARMRALRRQRNTQ